MRLQLSLALAIVTVAPAFGDDVPFAAPPPPHPGQGSETYSGSLGDIMISAQLRHIKLWYAGKAANWGLMKYELQQMKDAFDKAAVLYRNIPIELVISVEKPLISLYEAADAKSATKFAQGFGELTSACNACHQAAGVGFIAIQTPTSMLFGDQKFEPVGK
jgi:mono/diheme cytochrome c family protein